MKSLFKYIFSGFMLLQFFACIEAIEIETEDYENLLVIEATITDEEKHQEILLNRTLPLYEVEDEENEEEIPQLIVETDAHVRLVAGDAIVYNFFEEEPGHYLSEEVFKALPNVEYTLEIETSKGRIYRSEVTTLAKTSPIDNIDAERTILRGEDGVAITVFNFNEEESGTNFYKYEFEETYKIVSRYTSNYNLEYIDGELQEVPKTREETVCYNTEYSTEILLANTSSLNENRLEDFLVRFIPADDPVLSQRYSILVKQIALSSEAFFYYTTLKKLSGSDNIFSQSQPGFVKGNIFNEENESEQVIGHFNVSSVSTSRFYFNFEDFYIPSEEPRPTFATECNPSSPSIGPPPQRIENLITLLEMGYVKYLGPDAPGEDSGPFRVVEAPCVDCNIFGSNVKPDFWEDED